MFCIPFQWAVDTCSIQGKYVGRGGGVMTLYRKVPFSELTAFLLYFYKISRTSLMKSTEYNITNSFYIKL